MARYAFHVRSKSGEDETTLKTQEDEMPRAGEIIGLVLHGKQIKARVRVVTLPLSHEGSETVIEIYADEI
jgi:hypothetical protein